MSDCNEALLNTLGQLEANSANQRPQPLFFSGANCQGSQSPSNTTSETVAISVNGDLRSAIIPQGWVVTLSATDQNNGEQTFRIPQVGSTSYTLVIEDFRASLYRYPRGSVADNVKLITSTPDQALDDWKFNMCMGRQTTEYGIGAVDQTWQMGTPECDEYMTAYCKNNPKSIECSCLQEESELNSATCATFDDIESPVSVETCTDKNKFALFLNPACFGKNCAGGGAYRFGRMRGSCNINLCRQKINLIGDQLERSGASTLYCGNQNITVTDNGSRGQPVSIKSQTTVDEDKSTNKVETKGTPIWLIIVAMIGCFLVFVGVPVIYILSRNRKNVNQETENEQADSL